jgi:hypothetical protein
MNATRNGHNCRAAVPYPLCMCMCMGKMVRCQELIGDQRKPMQTSKGQKQWILLGSGSAAIATTKETIKL